MSAVRWPERIHWWIDRVGGYLTLTKPVVHIGHAGERRNDVAILADLSARHAELHIEAQGVVLFAHSETAVNNVAGASFWLKDGDRIKLRSVELKYHQPLSWSRTARLELVSRHRLPLALDGVLLLSETCVLGSRGDAHIPTPWEKPVCITAYRGAYWLRGPGEILIDGQKYPGWGPLTPSSRVEAEWGSFRLEPVSAK